MNLTYRLEGIGYVIMNHGVDWFIQDTYVPFPRETIEESAQAHIDDIIAKAQEAVQEAITIEQLQQQILSQQEQIDALVLAQLMQGGSL
ncbi:hypothetical protein [Paenibacillus endoradicis]|uniref:hypothetical protein n=1 Tax=Paenibacillus endoradicis TaxID=2972487 RepID=UPI002158BE5E|nr:hypothetical protein [Paenibacillus endoradicis]MCR8658971.1 hypothetical protein [Paenibacillus endoradicis]